MRLTFTNPIEQAISSMAEEWPAFALVTLACGHTQVRLLKDVQELTHMNCYACGMHSEDGQLELFEDMKG